MTAMTNRDRFKRAFSSIRIPDDFVPDLKEEAEPKKMHRSSFRSFAAAVCAVLAVLIGGTACYAADVGGIQRTIQVWFHGDQTDAVMTVDGESGAATWTIQDENGEEIHSGGVTINNDGSTSPLTEKDVQKFYE